MKRITHKTLRVRKSEYNRLRLDLFASAGPNPCISGMKEKYYGIDSYCILCDRYLYKVNADTYYRAMS